MRTAALHIERRALAVLAPDEVGGPAYADCLSEREQARFAAIRRPERRRRWLAGRLAAKYLFLMQMDRAGTVGGGPPVLVPLTPEHLAAFLPWMYRHVEVLQADGGGAPRLTWGGAPCPTYRLSLSHADSATCACIAEGNALGIDLEQATPRDHVFYRGNFTEGEHTWTVRSACETGLPPAWLYTLLWTLKEAALKSNVLERAISVWDFPRIDVQLLADPRSLKAASGQARLGDRFLTCAAQITGPDRRAEVRVAMTATRRLILTILTT